MIKYRNNGNETIRIEETEYKVRPTRRKFSQAYKERILAEADNCQGHGEIGGLLRREGLYSSHLTTWRRQAMRGELGAEISSKRGRQMQPKDLVADEKHTWLNGEKSYIATTVGGECVLGTAMSLSAAEKELAQAYGQFKTEAFNVDPDYQPDSVNTDGWKATVNAWLTLFPAITMILCFLHSFIKIRNCGKKLGAPYFELCTKVWAVYHAASTAEFHAQIADLAIWALEHLPDGPTLDAVIKLCLKYDSFAEAYAFPAPHRTSNMVDRHMGLMTAPKSALTNRDYSRELI